MFAVSFILNFATVLEIRVFFVKPNKGKTEETQGPENEDIEQSKEKHGMSESGVEVAANADDDKKSELLQR